MNLIRAKEVGARAARLTRMALARWMRRTDAVCISLLLIGTIAVYGRMLLGEPPWSHDHSIHMIKTVETEQLLKRGHLTGWSDMEFAGYPANVLYPFGSYVVIAILHALPGVSLLTAYSWGVFLCIFAGVIACYLAGRLHFSPATGVLAGLMALLDPGDFEIGGWNFSILWGVWPCAVAGAMVLIAMSLLPRALARGTVRSLAIVGLLLGASVIFHPVAILLALVSAPLLLLAAWSCEPQLLSWRMLGQLAIVAIGVVTACAFWVVPFVVMAQKFGIHELNWVPYHSKDVWGALWDGSLVKLGLWQGAALCGLLLAARRRDLFARFMIIAVPALIVLSNGDALVRLHLRNPSGTSPIDVMQLNRVYFLVRPLCYVAAAHALVTVAPSLGPWRGVPARRWVLRALLAVVIIFFVALPGARLPIGEALPDELTPSQRADLNRAFDAARSLVGPNDRIALYSRNPSDHFLVGPAALRGFNVAKIGYMPQTQFKNQLSTDDVVALAHAQVTALLSHGPTPSSWEPIKKVGRWGDFNLRVIERLPRAWIDGPGNARILEWNEQQIRIAVQGAGPNSQLRLMLSHYSAWRQTNGAPVQEYPFRRLSMSSVPATDGVVTLRYRRSPSEWAGLALSLLGLASLVFLIWRERQRTVTARQTF